MRVGCVCFMKKYLRYVLLILISFFTVSNVYAGGVVVQKVTPDFSDEDIIINPASGDYSFDVVFTKDNQEAKYNAVIQNKEEYSIKIDDIFINSPQSNFIEYSYEGIDKDTVIEPNGEVRVILTIKSNEKTKINLENDFILSATYSRIENTPSEPVENPETGIKNFIIVASVTIIIGGVGVLLINKKYNIFKSLCLFVALALTYSVLNVNAVENNTFVIRGKVSYKHTVKLTIKPNGGLYNNSKDDKVIDVLYNTPYGISNPTKDYYEFINWSINGTATISNNKITLKSDATITANYKAVYYTVTVDPNGGTYSGNTTNKIQAGTYYNILSVTKNTYDFIGWEVNPASKKIENNKILITEDVTIKALWNEVYYTLTIKPNGGMYNGSSENFVSKYRPNTVINLNIPTKTGYTFTNFSDGSKTYTNNITITKDTVLTANYSINHYNVTVNPITD